MLPVVEPLYPGFGTLLRRFGSRQIRHLGTLGGNLGTASPIGDLPPVLLALDAAVHVRSAAGARDIPAAEFFPAYRRTALQPGEFIAAVTLPRLGDGDFFGVHKLSKRYDQDISTLCAALHLRFADGRVREARLGLGGMAATPIRARRAEAALTGRTVDDAAIEAAVAALMGDVAPISDLRGSAEYRRRAAGNLLRRFRLEYAGVPYAAAVTAL
jgi:xanthine dehydrogenase small subunit